jgi:transglycosylase-like protein with SLT domain
MNDRERMALGLGLLGVGVFLFMKRKALSSIAIAALDAVNDEIFTLSLPVKARPYAAEIKQVASEQSIDPFLLVALVQREDPAWNPSIVSNDGGHGLTQITSDKAWIASAAWDDPYTNLTRGAQMLNDEINFFSGKLNDQAAVIQASLAAYNHGRPKVWANVQAGLSPDTGTTGGDYASAVWQTYQDLSDSFATSSSAATPQVAGWQDAGAGRRGGSGPDQV